MLEIKKDIKKVFSFLSFILKDTILTVGKKIFKNNIIEKIIFSKEKDKLEFTNEISEEDKSLITDIYNNIKNNSKSFNLYYFRKNIKTLRLGNIEEYLKLIIKNLPNQELPKERRFVYKGSYNIRENIVYNDDRRFFSHEIIHVACNDTSKIGTIRVGFYRHQKNGNNYIGLGLSEGYTNLFDGRYFAYSLGIGAYPFETRFALLIEKLITKEKMEKYYSNQDLLSLVLELKKYDSIRNIIFLLKDIDYISNCFVKAKDNKTFPMDSESKIKKVFYKLIKYNLSKLKTDYNNGTITREEQIYNIIDLIKITLTEIIDDKITCITYNFFNETVNFEELTKMFMLSSNEKEKIKSYLKIA